ncbi:hypothetical protein J6590_015447 [Homalodisca vitripennis]|nr:hypothetical protein J6590_015447 [Homalodisca vitripennis]
MFKDNFHDRRGQQEQLVTSTSREAKMCKCIGCGSYSSVNVACPKALSLAHSSCGHLHCFTTRGAPFRVSRSRYTNHNTNQRSCESGAGRRMVSHSAMNSLISADTCFDNRYTCQLAWAAPQHATLLSETNFASFSTTAAAATNSAHVLSPPDAQVRPPADPNLGNCPLPRLTAGTPPLTDADGPGGWNVEYLDSAQDDVVKNGESAGGTIPELPASKKIGEDRSNILNTALVHVRARGSTNGVSDTS